MLGQHYTCKCSLNADTENWKQCGIGQLENTKRSFCFTEAWDTKHLICKNKVVLILMKLPAATCNKNGVLAQRKIPRFILNVLHITFAITFGMHPNLKITNNRNVLRSHPEKFSAYSQPVWTFRNKNKTSFGSKRKWVTFLPPFYFLGEYLRWFISLVWWIR